VATAAPAGNWVCLAHLPRDPRLPGPVPPGVAGQIGFVCTTGPRGEGGNRRGCRCVRRELGLFGAFAPRPPSPRPRPTRRSRKLGLFVQHPSPPGPVPPGAAGNGGMIEQYNSGVCRPPEIGFVCSQRHPSLLRNTPNWLCLYNQPPTDTASVPRFGQVGLFRTFSRKKRKDAKETCSPAALGWGERITPEGGGATCLPLLFLVFKSSIIIHKSQIRGALPQSRLSPHIGAVLHESCRNSVRARGLKITELLMPEGIKNLSHAGRFTFSTVAQTWSQGEPTSRQSLP